jgi:hypothetical protein
LSHLKKGSFKVSKGDHVKKGDMLASCGNSGRSPVPHLHFQIQSTPFIGSKTISYPISQFIVHEKGNYSLRTFDIPESDTRISNTEKNEVMVKAFHLIPGQKAKFRVTDTLGADFEVNWEVLADPGNRTYVYCDKSGSKAYYHFDNDILHFTHFEGNRESLLFYYYLGAFRVSTGFYPGLELRDTYPITIMKQRTLLFFQDFVAPFRIFMRPQYSLSYLKIEDHFTHSKLWLKAETSMRIGTKELRKTVIEFEATRIGMERIIITEKKKRTEAIRAEE